MIKKCISLFLALVLLFSILSFGASATETPKYGYVSVYLIDEKKKVSCEVMSLDANLYINAEFYKDFGFEVKINDGVAIIGNVADSDLPKGAIGFYYDDTKCCRVNDALTEYYQAPFKTVKNDKGVWIPFEYSMNLLNGSMLVNDEGLLIISSPKQGLLDVLHNISAKWQTYSFDYAEDFGYGNGTENFLNGATHLVNVLNGLITFDGATWLSFINSDPILNSVLGDLGYDAKYGSEVAQMVCTNSSEELLDAVDAIDAANEMLSEDGALAEIFDDLRSTNEADLGKLLSQSQDALKNIEKTNDGVSEYNRIYAQLEKALVKSDFLEIGDVISDVQKSLGKATTGLKFLASIAEYVSYYNEFKNRDLYAVESFENFVDELPYVAGDVSFYTKTAMKAGVKSYKTNATTYSMGNFVMENIDDFISDGISLCTKANIALLTWDLVSSFYPFISDSLSAADKHELSVYAMVVQNEALRIFNEKRTEILSSNGNLTEEGLKELSDYAYVYLKLCYVSRNAAIGGIVTTTDEGKEASEILIDDLNKINSEIASLLNVTKSSVNKESFVCLGIVENTVNVDSIAFMRDMKKNEEKQLINTLVYFLYQNESYSNLSGGAVDYAMNCLVNCMNGCYWYFDNLFGWESNYDNEICSPMNSDGSFVASDPLGCFNIYAYSKTPMDKINWLLENVFCIDPSDVSNKTSYGEFEYPDWYFHGGFCYAPVYPGGDIGREVTITDYSLTDDGYGEFSVTSKECSDGKNSFWTIKAKLNNVNNINYWSFYEISKVMTSVDQNLHEEKNSEYSLNPKVIKDLFIKANNLYDGWICHGWTPELDYNDIIMVDGWEFARIESNEFNSVDALEEELKQYFSKEIYEERLNGYYKMHNGKMYGTCLLGQGGEPYSEKLSMEINYLSSKECTFTVTSYYESGYTSSSNYKIKFVDGRWIFVESFTEHIDLYFNNKIKWIE